MIWRYHHFWKHLFGACDFETKKNVVYVVIRWIYLYVRKNSEDLLLFIEHVDFREVQTRSKFSGDHWDVPKCFLGQAGARIPVDISGYWWACEYDSSKQNAHPTGIRILYLHTYLWLEYAVSNPLLSVYIINDIDVGNSFLRFTGFWRDLSAASLGETKK